MTRNSKKQFCISIKFLDPSHTLLAVNSQLLILPSLAHYIVSIYESSNYLLELHVGFAISSNYICFLRKQLFYDIIQSYLCGVMN